MIIKLLSYKHIKVFILIFALLIFSVLFMWLRNHAFIAITVDANGRSSITYRFTNLDNGSSQVISTVDTSINRLVSTGDYEIQILHNNSSHIINATVGSFLKKTSVNSRLALEQDRVFVGYNPAPCNTYLANILQSFECGANVSSVTQHIPATQSTPTYTLGIDSINEAPINGIAYTKFGTVVLTGPVFTTEEDLVSDYTVGLLNEKFNLTEQVLLDNLALGKNYTITDYRDGFLIYSTDLSDAYYYSELGVEPEIITFDEPRDPESLPLNLSTNDRFLVSVYSNSLGRDGDEEEVLSDNTKSQINIFGGGSSKQYYLNGQVLKALPCFERLCVLFGDGRLDIYKTDEDQLKKTFTLTKVEDIVLIGNQIKAVNATGIITINVDSGNAFYDYNFGKFIYCGINEVNNGFVLCLIGADNNKFALRVDSSSKIKDPIDKNIYQLQKNNQIADVSIYKNFIFLTPALKKVNNIYSTEEIERGKDMVKDAVKDSAINITEYTIVNTTAPF